MQEYFRVFICKDESNVFRMLFADETQKNKTKTKKRGVEASYQF